MKHLSKRGKKLKQWEKKKLIKKITIWSLIIIVVIGFIFWIIYSSEKTPNYTVTDLDSSEIPQGQVHWHPKLTIKINNETIVIPNDIGSRTGRIVDTHLSGMRMSPLHTHESDGTIHLENNNPSSKPETVTLGYFFYVWDKPFNETCIFEYCTDKGQLKMYVNGEESFKFGEYIMKDKDEILLEYKSN
jgi:hypothetical protein